ncbi:hypothetical protein P9209_03390 [Prescottella defluvii]|nr:hypothetical protein P9209_03390 [Prescottella defluvii]
MTRTIKAQELVDHIDGRPTLIELDNVDKDGHRFRRSALIDKTIDDFKYDRTPQNLVKVMFAEPGIEPQSFDPEDDVVVHYVVLDHPGVQTV